VLPASDGTTGTPPPFLDKFPFTGVLDVRGPRDCDSFPLRQDSVSSRFRLRRVSLYVWLQRPSYYLDVCGDQLEAFVAWGVSVGLNMHHEHSRVCVLFVCWILQKLRCSVNLQVVKMYFSVYCVIYSSQSLNSTVISAHLCMWKEGKGFFFFRYLFILTKFRRDEYWLEYDTAVVGFAYDINCILFLLFDKNVQLGYLNILLWRIFRNKFH